MLAETLIPSGAITVTAEVNIKSARLRVGKDILPEERSDVLHDRANPDRFVFVFIRVAFAVVVVHVSDLLRRRRLLVPERKSMLLAAFLPQVRL